VSQQPTTRDAILALLAEQGPLTAAQIAEELNKTRRSIDGALNGARKKYGTQYFRIAGYARQVGIRGREAPQYAPGPKPDAKRPDMRTDEDAKRIQARYREKYRYILRLRTQKRRHGSINPFLAILGKVSS